MPDQKIKINRRMLKKKKLGDFVVVIKGGNRGQRGKIKSISAPYVSIEGVGMKKRRIKHGENKGNIEEFEKLIHISNIAQVDPKTNYPTKVGYKFITEKDKVTKVRISKKTGELL